MKILVAPLNWGLGHASRCVPLVQRFLDEGHEVILGGDGDSLTLLRKHFPTLRYVYLAPLRLRYSAGSRQVWAMVKALPRLMAWCVKDHALLKAVLREEQIDRVVSDNRFGLYAKQTECVYITHQLHIFLPKGWRWAERIAARLHARAYAHFNKVWVPDYEAMESSLAGALSHTDVPGTKHRAPVEYIGPLSRFYRNSPDAPREPHYQVVAVLSGLEPQRTLLEQQIRARYQDRDEQVMIVQGLPGRPNTRIKRGNITMVPTMGDEELAKVLTETPHIIARSGYSTIMDMDALGLINQPSTTINQKIELIPTPGQPEQEYLANWIKQKTLF